MVASTICSPLSVSPSISASASTSSFLHEPSLPEEVHLVVLLQQGLLYQQALSTPFSLVEHLVPHGLHLPLVPQHQEPL